MNLLRFARRKGELHFPFLTNLAASPFVNAPKIDRGQVELLERAKQLAIRCAKEDEL